MNERKYQIIQELLEKMFEYAGHYPPNQTLRETKRDWYNNYTMSKEAKQQWIAWGTTHLQSEMGLPRDRAATEMQMLDLTFGLKSY